MPRPSFPWPGCSEFIASGRTSRTDHDFTCGLRGAGVQARSRAFVFGFDQSQTGAQPRHLSAVRYCAVHAPHRGRLHDDVAASSKRRGSASFCGTTDRLTPAHNGSSRRGEDRLRSEALDCFPEARDRSAYFRGCAAHNCVSLRLGCARSNRSDRPLDRADRHTWRPIP